MKQLLGVAAALLGDPELLDLRHVGGGRGSGRTLARGPALAVGLGMVWALAVESLLRGVYPLRKADRWWWVNSPLPVRVGVTFL